MISLCDFRFFLRGLLTRSYYIIIYYIILYYMILYYIMLYYIILYYIIYTILYYILYYIILYYIILYIYIYYIILLLRKHTRQQNKQRVLPGLADVLGRPRDRTSPGRVEQQQESCRLGGAYAPAPCHAPTRSTPRAWSVSCANTILRSNV